MLRSITAMALALVLGLTSVAMGLAGGQVPAADAGTVICTGAGIVTVPAGGEDAPVLLHCPDCAPNALDTVLAEPAMVGPVQGAAALALATAGAAQVVQPPLMKQPTRAPPDLGYS